MTILWAEHNRLAPPSAGTGRSGRRRRLRAYLRATGRRIACSTTIRPTQRRCTTCHELTDGGSSTTSGSTGDKGVGGMTRSTNTHAIIEDGPRAGETVQTRRRTRGRAAQGVPARRRASRAARADTERARRAACRPTALWVVTTSGTATFIGWRREIDLRGSKSRPEPMTCDDRRAHVAGMITAVSLADRLPATNLQINTAWCVCHDHRRGPAVLAPAALPRPIPGRPRAQDPAGFQKSA